MNLLEIIVLAALAALVISGFVKGFVHKLAVMLSLAASVVLVSVFLPYITEFLKERTPVYEYIAGQCREAVYGQVGELDFPGLTLTDGIDSDLLNLSDEQQAQVIQNLPLPEFLREQLLKYNNQEGFRSLNASTFMDYLINYVATAILNVLSYILAVFLVQTVLRLLIRALDILARFPVVSMVNRLAGGALGLLEGLFLLWLFFLILSILETAGTAQPLLRMVWESPILSFLYDTNLFLQIVLRGAAVFA